MAEKEHSNHTEEADVKRSTEDIRQDIAKEEQNLSQTVEQISERIKEKLDWRAYVKDYPYWALGAAAGLGYVASKVLIPRTTPIERIVGSIEKVRDSLSGQLAGAVRPGLIKVTLLGIATKAAAGWIKSVTPTVGTSDGAGPRPQTGRDSTMKPRVEPRVDTQKTTKSDLS